MSGFWLFTAIVAAAAVCASLLTYRLVMKGFARCLSSTSQFLLLALSLALWTFAIVGSLVLQNSISAGLAPQSYRAVPVVLLLMSVIALATLPIWAQSRRERLASN